MHGPGPVSPTNPLGWSPHYDRPIPVDDTLAPTLGPVKRAVWRTARDKALANWNLPFAVREVPGFIQDGTKFFSELVRPGRITIVRQTYQAPPGSYYPDTHAWYDTNANAGLVFLRIRPWWYKPWKASSLMGIVGHEVGHTLGLSHRQDKGIMAGAWKPDEHDLDSVQTPGK